MNEVAKQEVYTELYDAIKNMEKGITSYFNNDKEKIKKFQRTLIDYVNENQIDTSKIEIYSIIESAKKIARLDLTLGGDVDIIPRGKKCRAELNYKGYLTLITRNNIPARAEVVYAEDTFDIDIGKNEVSHKPGKNRGDKNNIIGFYAKIKIAGEWLIDYMNKTEMDRFKDKFASKNYKGEVSPAWQNAYAEMGKKTILKRLIKSYQYAINNKDINEATEIDNENYDKTGQQNIKETLDENHSKYKQVINAYKNGIINYEYLKKHYFIPEETEQIINN